MEPISVALTAFTAIKAGVTAGKEISSLAGDLGKLWDACDAANAKHSKKRNSQFNMSANEEALSTFVAKQQAKDLEDELRELIIYTRGQSAWHELLQLRADIKRERKEAELLAKRQREEKLEMLLVIGGTVLLGAMALGLVWFVVVNL
tara:strand:+ start:1999 stop:2442 length:444 start_codon:yes stop_codon:yes gene_type:complete